MSEALLFPSRIFLIKCFFGPSKWSLINGDGELIWGRTSLNYSNRKA
jgi:hypothetical protein